ncbi:MAG: DEAD/DEAH box helicase family protein [Planctomycetota bacterium]
MFKPKPYQEETIQKLADYLESARFDGAKAAFDAAPRSVPAPWRKPYKPLPDPEDAPYVCLRLPTGGGKTFLAAQCIKIGAKFLGREKNPLVLWLVPTKTIREQSLETLLDPNHPNRQTLEADFEGKLRVLDIADFTQLTPQDLRDKACIVIGTFAALRVGDTEGRKVYDHNEQLEPHFSQVPPAMSGLELHTDGPDKDKVKFSLANIMALIRPLVIVDEAHNATTVLSYEVLQRVKAGCVIEFTATPAGDSNVLHHVSASELKTQNMIKLPIILTEHPTWQEALTDTILKRKALDDLAKNEPDFVRPIVLIQAESKDREVTVGVVEKYLVEQGKIERERIAIATGSQRELDGVKLLDPSCKIEFIITVQALKEGWDCPFAYVFCSVATVRSAKDVEQLLGRVLRMPYAKRRTHDDLNKAYAFVSKGCWPRAVNELHDRLVNMGFDEVEAAAYVKPEFGPTLFPIETQLPLLSWSVKEAPILDNLPSEIKENVMVVRESEGTYKVSVAGTLDPEAEAMFIEAMPQCKQEAIRQAFAARREGLPGPLPHRPKIEPFRVPQLCLWIDGKLEPVEPEHWLPADSWSLLDFPAELTEEEFRIEDTGDTYVIDVQGKRLTIDYAGQQKSIAFSEAPANWTDLELSRQLDRSLKQDDIRQEVLLEFIRRTIRMLIERRRMSLATLYMARLPLERALRLKIDSCRKKAASNGYQSLLFGAQSPVETSFVYAFNFDPDDYPVKIPYKGVFNFPKHFYGRLMGDMNGPEEECAREIEKNPHVKRWVRNLDRMFSLQLAHGNFYPDFVAELDDERILVVEYKGEHLIEHEQQKKNIGELWENKSRGKGLFLWAVEKDEFGRDVYRQLEGKITEK